LILLAAAVGSVGGMYGIGGGSILAPILIGTGRPPSELAEATGADDFGDDAIPALLRAAAADLDGFRLLFRHAAREPEFRDLTDSLTAASQEVAERNLVKLIPQGPWLAWASRLIPA
jgi:hypothetical protein